MRFPSGLPPDMTARLVTADLLPLISFLLPLHVDFIISTFFVKRYTTYYPYANIILKTSQCILPIFS